MSKRDAMLRRDYMEEPAVAVPMQAASSGASGGTVTNHGHTGTGDGGSFDAGNLGSGAATDGQVLTSDGSGGAAWEDAAGGAVDAADVTYTPTTAADWDGGADPGDADGALDQLAERVKDIEDAGGGGAPDASAVTYTPTTATDWDSDADPGDVDQALDQLAERVDDLEAGGGGATITVWMPDAPPATASDHDDEFDDASFDTGFWSEIDNGTDLTVTEDEAGLALTAVTSAGCSVCGVYHAIPAGDFTIVTKVSLDTVIANYLFAGPALFEDGADNTKRIIAHTLSSEASYQGLYLSLYTTWSNFSGTNYLTRVNTWPPTHLYLRIRRTGTTYSFDCSTDGIGWLRVYTTAALAFTPTHFGLVVNNWNTGVTAAARFAFWRYLASDVGLTGVLGGDRVSVARA